jgi:catechol 2,3-dioxygenase-like lactoylglutathione lyase family enzyme
MNDTVKNRPMTRGCHHVGLSVSKLEESARFFTELLGWQEVRRDDDYPAIFVSDGTIMVTLWKSQTDIPAGFDKNNIGLHHVALMVESEDILDDCYHRILDSKLEIEFSPELLRDGPAKHMICNEPSGIRVELIWPGT